LNKLTLIFLALFAGTILAVEKPPASPQQPPVDFDARTLKAFDRTGKHVTLSKARDGSDRVSFNESFQHVTVGRIGADGRIETLCTGSEEEARRFLSYQAPFELPSAPAVGADQK
jgi:hypothetical protein